MQGRSALVIGIVGLLLAVPGTVVALEQMGQIDWLPTGPDRSDSPEPPGDCAAELTLSTGSAPRGGEVTVYGSCFQPGERVVIRVHTTEVGSATAGSDGGFEQTVTIPNSAPPPGFPTDISAVGKSSVRHASAPFSTAS